MKIFIARFLSLVIGAAGLFLSVFTSEYTAASIFEFAVRAIVVVGFIAYGLGGNSLLAKIHALKIFSLPINKEQLKSLDKSTSQGKV